MRDGRATKRAKNSLKAIFLKFFNGFTELPRSLTRYRAANMVRAADGAGFFPSFPTLTV